MNVIGTIKQLVLVGIPNINITEMYDNIKPISSRQQNNGLVIIIISYEFSSFFFDSVIV